MDTLVRIFAKYSENYGLADGGTPYFKDKGTVEYELRASDDLFMYESDICIEAIKALLTEQSNSYVKYEYLSHELVFHEPVKLDSAKFKAMVCLAHASKEEKLN